MGLTQMTNKDDIIKIISKVCEVNQKQVQDYKNGNAKMLQFLIGMCMKESGGKVNPKILNEELLKFLDGR
jgi:aspartyl-tRNA(Asn)/glutamyl-tRNA(Gln) amidotransferase subunit B